MNVVAVISRGGLSSKVDRQTQNYNKQCKHKRVVHVILHTLFLAAASFSAFSASSAMVYVAKRYD